MSRSDALRQVGEKLDRLIEEVPRNREAAAEQKVFAADVMLELARQRAIYEEGLRARDRLERHLTGFEQRLAALNESTGRRLDELLDESFAQQKESSPSSTSCDPRTNSQGVE